MTYLLRRDRDSNTKVLRPVRANIGVEAAFRRRLVKMIEAMAASVQYWVEAAYKAHMPRLAMDAIPANELRDAMAKLSRQWTNNFDELSDWLADYFAKDVADRSDAALQSALRNAGFTVKFVITPAMRDVMAATVHQSTQLIKSIPAQYLGQVEGMVMRSVQTGRDLGQLSKDLQEQLGVTKKRAAFIARDQNEKATSALQRTRQIEMGVERAIWSHSHAGRHPRKTHVAMNNKPYDPKIGMWDSAINAFTFPGQEINCRCSSRSIISALQ